MLAQAFKAAADLDITEPQKEALMKTLVLLDTGKLVHVPDDELAYVEGHSFTGHFNMTRWAVARDCGTVACIGGTAELLGGYGLRSDLIGGINAKLSDLFNPDNIKCGDWHRITPAQAATALRSYLTTGDAKWHEAVA